LINLKEFLEQTGLPVVYHHWESPPDPPYIVYVFTDSENFGADDRVYARGDDYDVELYSDKKDPVTEKILEDLFDEYDIFYEKSEVWIESERMYEVIYEI